MDAKNHPTVRHGTGWLRCQGWSAAVLFAGLAILLLRDPSALHVLGAVALVAGAGLSIRWVEKEVKRLRYEYRYSDDEPAQ